jgi:D,D-heptose 1,7-bisphosphate phosphatase
MQAVILAGGRGARLGDYTREIPKPMMIIGDKPLLHHQVDLLVSYGIQDIILLVNYLKDPIISYFGDGAAFNARISYFEEPVPLGTTGGVREIEERLRGDFLLLYGDVMFDMDISRLVRFHNLKNSKCTLVLHPNDHPFDSDLAEINPEGRIVGFHPKPHKPGNSYHNLVNAGICVFSPDVLKFIEKGKKADFGRDVFPGIFNRLEMYGYKTPEYLKDMGTPDRLEMVRLDLENGKIQLRNLKNRQRAIFLDRDGVLNVERSFISTPEGLELYDFTPSAVKLINQSNYLSVVVTNQSAIARNLCTEDDVHAIHKKLETLLGDQQSWLDAIYFCPHHPDSGFPEENPAYKIDCECRKPKTGMFLNAAADLNINLNESWMIGDSERDILAGINAGCTTVGVRTGYGIKKTRILPDYMFSNLYEAVNFITHDPLGSYTERIISQVTDEGGNMPRVLLIGGNTRTGKSTLASCLRIALEKKGKSVLVVGLDNWLIPEEQRTDEMDVYARFQLGSIERDVKKLIAGETIIVNTYANHPERETVPLVYMLKETDVVIIEGVVALSSAIIRDMADLRLFTSLPPVLFEARIYEYYTWRGKTAAEIRVLVEKRKDDEYQLIEKESNLADMIINLSGA